MVEIPSLIESRLCFQSRKTRGILIAWNIAHHAIEIHFGSRSALKRFAPKSVYQATPVLVHEGRTVEDFRAILLYLDATYCHSELARSAPSDIDRLFQILDKFDNEIFPALIAPALAAWAAAPTFGRIRRTRRVRPYLPGDNLDPRSDLLMRNFESAVRAASDNFTHAALPAHLEKVLVTCVSAVLYGLKPLTRFWEVVKREDSLYTCIAGAF